MWFELQAIGVYYGKFVLLNSIRKLNWSFITNLFFQLLDFGFNFLTQVLSLLFNVVVTPGARVVDVVVAVVVVGFVGLVATVVALVVGVPKRLQ